jgi:ubiquinone/menaquinone biosynthesis C-methylase UbiE
LEREKKPHGAGRSTFQFVDGKLLFDALRLAPSFVVVDLGCGKGDYSIPMAARIGPQGKVFAVDAWQGSLDELQRRAASDHLANVETVRADLNETFPLPDAIADLCFMASVLHDVLREGPGTTTLRETARVLKPGGRFAVVEFKKIDVGPGPPVSVRLSPEEVSRTLAPFGFTMGQAIDVGPYHYLVIAERSEGQ